MQDRFKFRVWCKTNQEWERDEICITNRNQYLIRNFAPKFTRTTDDEPQYHEINFCTGLKDKNGKLIYEGDIVRFYFDNDEIIAVIEWDDDECCFYLNTTDFFKDKYVTDYEIVNQEKYEVIGNIYENPELLKEDE